jgi:hypothetical protein
MTEIEMLELLSQYFDLQSDVTKRIAIARRNFEAGDEVGCWTFLFAWAEARDDRLEVWESLRHCDDRAWELKEGKP